MRKEPFLFLALAALLSLAACGGGSDSDDTQVTPPTGDGNDGGDSDGDDEDTNTDQRDRVWTFAVNEEPILTVVGQEYASFLGDYHVEDFDGDGYNDIFIGGPSWDNTDGNDGWSGSPARYEVLWGSEQSFELDTKRLFGENYEPEMIHVVDFIVADYDGNGYNDFIIAGSGHDVFEGAGDRVEYYQNTGQLPLENSQDKIDFDLSSFMHSGTNGDFNGDGYTDVSIWQCCFGPNVELDDTSGITLVNDGAGNFERNRELVPNEFAPEHVQETLGNYGSWSILESFAIDLNDSSCDDLIVAGGGEVGQPQILWNHCNGELSTPVLTGDEQTETYVLPPVEGYDVTLDVVVYPVNDDEFPDLLISHTTADYDGTYLQLLENNGDGTFTDVSDTSVSQTSVETSVGKGYVHDFDGDGYLDVLYRHAIYKGTEQGLEPVEFEINSIYTSFIAGDFNNDGHEDIIVRDVPPETFGHEDQVIEYTLLENIAGQQFQGCR